VSHWGKHKADCRSTKRPKLEPTLGGVFQAFKYAIEENTQRKAILADQSEKNEKGIFVMDIKDMLKPEEAPWAWVPLEKFNTLAGPSSGDPGFMKDLRKRVKKIKKHQLMAGVRLSKKHVVYATQLKFTIQKIPKDMRGPDGQGIPEKPEETKTETKTEEQVTAAGKTKPIAVDADVGGEGSSSSNDGDVEEVTEELAKASISDDDGFVTVNP